MKISSVGVTYRIEILQVFFEDETELVIKVGYALEQPFDLDIELVWVAGSAPKWAESLTPQEILKKAEEHNELEK